MVLTIVVIVGFIIVGIQLASIRILLAELVRIQSYLSGDVDGLRQQLAPMTDEAALRKTLDQLRRREDEQWHRDLAALDAKRNAVGETQVQLDA